MTNSEDAVKWVDRNLSMIIDRAKVYSDFTPYDVDDYIQDAYSAAVEAAMCCRQNPKLDFEGVFRIIFRRTVAKITPFPDQDREEYHKKNELRKREALASSRDALVEDICDEEMGAAPPSKKSYYSGGTSMSFSKKAQANFCLDILPDRNQGRSSCDIEEPYDIVEDLYVNQVKPLLSQREQMVMDLSLGITEEGSLSSNEVADRLGVSRRSVRTFVDRALKKAEARAKAVDFEKIKSSLRRFDMHNAKENYPEGGFEMVTVLEAGDVETMAC